MSAATSLSVERYACGHGVCGLRRDRGIGCVEVDRAAIARAGRCRDGRGVCDRARYRRKRGRCGRLIGAAHDDRKDLALRWNRKQAREEYE
jgi:uncharacterized low-complexity protein